MARHIADKVIIVTGASSGIGRETALALANEGARLLLVARREGQLREVENAARAAGGTAISLALDLGRRDEVERMIHAAHERFGRIDVLINNAGFGFFGSVENTPQSVVREIFALNFEAPLVASQLVIPIMRAQGGGHIINVSSIAGKRGLPLSGVYSATKFALHGLSESLRIELKGIGIHVSVINPASTRTEFHDQVRRGDVNGVFKHAGYVQPAKEVAEAIVRCIKSPRVEVYPNRASRLVAWMNAIVPSLVDRLMVRYLKDRLSAKIVTGS